MPPVNLTSLLWALIIYVACAIAAWGAGREIDAWQRRRWHL